SIVSMLRDTLIALGAFAVGTLVAELAGASNLGISIGVGQIAFITAVAILIGWPRSGDEKPAEATDPAD
ncbi:MAG: hypothetical protein ACO3UZ_05765, partial [Burkholderiaceae bacterium]